MSDQVDGVLGLITIVALAGTILYAWSPGSAGDLLLGLLQVGVFAAVGGRILQTVIGIETDV